MSALFDTASWGLILGVLLPLLTSVVQQPTWSAPLRAVVGLVAAVIGGFVTCLANGTVGDGQTLLSTIAVVLVAAQATYRGFYKPTGVAPGIEAATSPRAGRHAGTLRQ